MKALSLRTNLAVLASLLTLAGIAVGLVVVNWSLYQLRIASYDSESRLVAQIVLESAVVREDQSVRIPRVVESYLTDEGGIAAAQAYADGELVWDGGVIDAPRPLDAERLLTGGGPQSVDEWRVYTLRDEDAGIVVQVGRPLLALRETLLPLGAIAVPLALVLSLLSGASAWWLTGLALRPLRRLTAAAQGFEDDAEVPAIPGNDEPARLARSFSDLLARLRAERHREQRFLAYASHELRTPISALRAGLEAAASGRLTPNRELLGRLHQEAMRLESFAQNLLALSRAAAGDVRFETLELDRLVEDAYDRLLPLASERGIEMRVDAQPATVRGDPRLLIQAIDNLVSNALRYARTGDVELRSGTDDGSAWIEVRDRGPGMPARVEEGLGLRVVRVVAEVHGGRLEIASSVGAQVRVAIPTRDLR